MRIRSFELTRFQFARDRVIGDSQVRIDDVNVAALELIADTGAAGSALSRPCLPLPQVDESSAYFRRGLAGARRQPPPGLVHRVSRPRGGNQRAFSLPFHEAIQVALWDLAAKQAGLPLHAARQPPQPGPGLCLRSRLPSQRRRLRGVLRARRRAASRRSRSRSATPTSIATCSRLNLLSKAVRPGAIVMIDANEAWGAKEALVKLEAIRRRRLRRCCGWKTRSCATTSKACACCANAAPGR